MSVGYFVYRKMEIKLIADGEERDEYIASNFQRGGYTYMSKFTHNSPRRRCNAKVEVITITINNKITSKIK